MRSMTNFLRTAVEACGFGHYYGGYEGDSRIHMVSEDSTGKIWVPEHRHLVKGLVFGTLGAVAAGTVYANQTGLI